MEPLQTIRDSRDTRPLNVLMSKSIHPHMLSTNRVLSGHSSPFFKRCVVRYRQRLPPISAHDIRNERNNQKVHPKRAYNKIKPYLKLLFFISLENSYYLLSVFMGNCNSLSTTSTKEVSMKDNALNNGSEEAAQIFSDGVSMSSKVSVSTDLLVYAIVILRV